MIDAAPPARLDRDDFGWITTVRPTDKPQSSYV